MNKGRFKISVGITMGDPSGIGPSITVEAVNRLKGLAKFVVIGDRWVIERMSASELKLSDAELIDLNNVPRKKFTFGKIRAQYGRASIEYLDCALKLLAIKKIDCLVTCPISKEAINLGGFHWFGHTEYLADRTKTEDLVMLLLNKKLKIALVTRHTPLKSVASKLNKEAIYKTTLLTQAALKKLFCIKRPRIAICGLNPHASDNGLIGSEENKIIKPAIFNLKKRFACVEGPLPSDVAIKEAFQGKYDCLIAMYHDQALIPLKLIDAATGVNMTLGLKFIRTSPLHGTAFDIAGRPKLADSSSLIEAIRVAVICAANLKKS